MPGPQHQRIHALIVPMRASSLTVSPSVDHRLSLLTAERIAIDQRAALQPPPVSAANRALTRMRCETMRMAAQMRLDLVGQIMDVATTR